MWIGARQGQGSRGRKAQPDRPSGQLQACASLLDADAPGHSSQAGLQHKAAARPLSCHCCVTTHPSCWLSFSGCRDRADRPGSSRAVQSQGGNAGLSACRAVTPEHLVASPLGDEQRTGGVWIVLTLLDPSFLQLGFPLDFHLWTYQQCV